MILVFGKTGQLATELAKDPDMRCLGRDMADLTDPAACAALIARTEARAVINAAAYTAVDQAETEPDAAYAVISSDKSPQTAASEAIDNLTTTIP